MTILIIFGQYQACRLQNSSLFHSYDRIFSPAPSPQVTPTCVCLHIRSKSVILGICLWGVPVTWHKTYSSCSLVPTRVTF
jgi:hypothetical protein